MIKNPTRKGLEKLIEIRDNMVRDNIMVDHDNRIMCHNSTPDLYSNVYRIGKSNEGDAIIVAYAYRDMYREPVYSMNVTDGFIVATNVLLAIVKEDDKVIIGEHGWVHIPTNTVWVPEPRHPVWCRNELARALDKYIEMRRKVFPMLLDDGGLRVNGHPATIGHTQMIDGKEYVMTAYGEVNFGIEPTSRPLDFRGKLHEYAILEPVEDVR